EAKVTECNLGVRANRAEPRCTGDESHVESNARKEARGQDSEGLERHSPALDRFSPPKGGHSPRAAHEASCSMYRLADARTARFPPAGISFCGQHPWMRSNSKGSIASMMR